MSIGWQDIILIAVSYLLGAIPFGYLIARAKGVDIRSVGSGNIGATNVARALGKGFGILVFVLDVLKGFLPTLAARAWLHGEAEGVPLAVVLTGLAAIAGHNWPVTLRFKGGKGVATSCGVFLALFPTGLAIALGTWVLVVAVTRYVSLGSILGGAALFLAACAIPEQPFSRAQVSLTIFAGVAGLISVLRHRANIGRLLKGTENRIGGKTGRT